MLDLTRRVAELQEADQLATQRRLQALRYGVAALALALREGWTPERVADWIFGHRQKAGTYAERVAHHGYGHPWAAAGLYLRRLGVYARVLECSSDAGAVIIRHSPLYPGAAQVLGRFDLGPELQRAHRHYWLRACGQMGVEVAWETVGSIRTARFRASSGAHAVPLHKGWRPPSAEELLMLSRREVARGLAILVGIGADLNRAPERVGRVLAARLSAESLGVRSLGPWPAPARALTAYAAELHLGVSDEVRVREQDGTWTLESPPMAAEDQAAIAPYDALPHHVGRFFNGILEGLAGTLGLRAGSEVGYETLVTVIGRR